MNGAAAHSEKEILTGGKKTLKALVAEDDLATQWLITSYMEKEGHKVVMVNNGESAVQAACKELFDVVLLDMKMPVMEGLEAVSLIRKQENKNGTRRAPIIIMSANNTLEDKTRCFKAGADGWVAKPVSARELIEKIEEATSGGMTKLTPFDGAGHFGEKTSQKPNRAVFGSAEALRREPDDKRLQGEVARIFVQNHARYLSAIRSAIEEGDGAAVELAAHSLRGALEIFGVKSAPTLAAELEMLGRENRLEQAMNKFEALVRQVVVVAAMLNKRKAVSLSPTSLPRIKTGKGAILVVEDCEIQQSALIRVLEEGGYETVPVCSGAEAIEAAKKRKFGLILLDIHMPETSGMNVLKEIRNGGASADSNVIALSSDDRLDVVKMVVRLGACYYLKNPFDTGKLLAKAAKYFEPVKPENRSFAFDHNANVAGRGNEKGSGAEPDKTRRILVIEDNEAQRRIIAGQLKIKYQNIDEAGDGMTAVDMTTHTAYDLILLDIHMPGMTGLKTLEIIRSNKMQENARIIMVTIDNNVKTIKRSLSLGASDLLIKPFLGAQLMEKADKWIFRAPASQSNDSAVRQEL